MKILKNKHRNKIYKTVIYNNKMKAKINNNKIIENKVFKIIKE